MTKFEFNVGGRCPSCGHKHKFGTDCVVGIVPLVETFKADLLCQPEHAVKVDTEPVIEQSQPSVQIFGRKKKVVK